MFSNSIPSQAVWNGAVHFRSAKLIPGEGFHVLSDSIFSTGLGLETHNQTAKNGLRGRWGAVQRTAYLSIPDNSLLLHPVSATGLKSWGISSAG